MTFTGPANKDLLQYNGPGATWEDKSVTEVLDDDITIGGDLTVTGGNVGIGTAANASYVLYAYKGTGAAESRFRSVDNAVYIITQGATGYDAGFIMMEGASNKVAMYNDASLDKFSFYNYGSAETLSLSDAGGAGYNGAFDIGGVATLDSGGDDITSTDIADLLMFGSANAAWVPCILDGTGSWPTGKLQGDWTMSNVDGTDFWAVFRCPLPTTKGSLKLYVAGTQVGILDADAAGGGDYVSTTNVIGLVYNSNTTLDTNTTNYQSNYTKQSYSNQKTA